MAAPSLLTTVYPDRQGVNDILGEAGVRLRLDDNHSGAVSTAEEAMLTRLYSEATAWVRMYLSAKYDLSDYPSAGNPAHWLIYRWSCVRAALLLCKRRGNPAMGSLADMYKEAVATLEALRDGAQTLNDLAMNASPSMSLSNVRLDPRKHTKQLVVESTISDPTRSKTPQNRDWVPDLVPEVQP